MPGLELADYFGIATSIFLPIMPIPQIVHTFRTKSAKDINILYILFQIIANSTFLIFGILRKEMFVMIPNAALIFLNIVIIFLKYYYQIFYKKKDSTENA